MAPEVKDNLLRKRTCQNGILYLKGISVDTYYWLYHKLGKGFNTLIRK